MCKHEFIGNAEGVKCSLCGTELTREEYKAYLNPKEEPKETPKEKKAEPKKAKKK